MRSDLKELLEFLSDMEYHTAVDLSERLSISPKTVRNRLKELGEIGKTFGVILKAKSSCGFILCQETGDSLERLKKELDTPGNLPDSSEDRTNYLLVYLLNHDGYTKIDELCDFLCVSRSTLQSSMRKVKEILEQYHIQLETKPNYGICVVGSEFDIRRCIGECFVRRNMLDLGMQLYLEEELSGLGDIVLKLTGKYKISLSEGSFEHLIIQIYVAMKRIKHGNIITLTEHIELKKYGTEWKMIQELALLIEDWQGIHYCEDELTYIIIYLAGIRLLGGGDPNAANFVIREELDQLVLDMLESVYNEYRIELRNNFNLRMSFNQHMVPLDIRIRYHIKILNPILDEIKKNYAFAYTLAEKCAMVLEEYYKQDISQDEVGYFAVLLALGLEQHTTDIRKSRILVVCGAGRGSSRILRYKYEQEFGTYLETINICGVHELPLIDFSRLDYVFTTVPIYRQIPIPIIEVGEFLERADIVKVKGVLERGKVDFLDNYYRADQFLTDIKGDTREEVIANICEIIGTQRVLPEGFLEAVLERERLAQTDFGNYIAMPHPYKVITEETFVYVAILEKEIQWSRHPVQLVFLAAISDKEDKNLPRFYDVTMRLFTEGDLVRQILEQKQFSVLTQMLRQIYYVE